MNENNVLNLSVKDGVVFIAGDKRKKELAFSVFANSQLTNNFVFSQNSHRDIMKNAEATLDYLESSVDKINSLDMKIVKAHKSYAVIYFQISKGISEHFYIENEKQFKRCQVLQSNFLKYLKK